MPNARANYLAADAGDSIAGTDLRATEMRPIRIACRVRSERLLPRRALLQIEN